MGTPKQLLPIGGQSLVRRAASTALASGADDVVVVIGQAADEVEHELRGLAVRSVRNERFAEGQATSLNAAVRALSPETSAAIVVLVDQPLLTAMHVSAVIERYRIDRPPLVLPIYSGRRGNPVLFDRTLFPELLAIEGDQGARDVIARHWNEAALVELGDAESQRDVDTWDEYLAMKALLEREHV